MKFVILGLFVVVAILAMIATTLWLQKRELKRRIDGLEEPELWLPRKERQAHARKLLAREDTEYADRQQEKYERYLQAPLMTKDEAKEYEK